MSIRIIIEAIVKGDHATITRTYTETFEDGGVISHKQALWSGSVADLLTTKALLTAEEADDHAQTCLEEGELMPMGKVD